MINRIFEHKTANGDKLLAFGFTEQDGIYRYETEILDGQFKLFVKIRGEKFEASLIDTVTNEPYTLHLVESATGTFVGSVRKEYEKILSEIADNCFEKNVFKSKQAQEVINFISGKFGCVLEFLWEKFPNNAVWRRNDNNKWFGILLTVSKKKLGINSDEEIEIIDLRAEPEEIKVLIDNRTFFTGYHMNKKHWITIVLDYTVPSEKIFKLIDKSYLIAGNKK